MLNRILAYSILTVAACNGSAPKPTTTPIAETTSSTSPAPATPAAPTAQATEFAVWLSNQSFKTPTIDLVVKIDGAEVFRGDLKVEGQHTFKKHSLMLAPGKHKLEAVTSQGGAKLELEFELSPAKRYATLFYAQDTSAPATFVFNQYDREPAFM